MILSFSQIVQIIIYIIIGVLGSFSVFAQGERCDKENLPTDRDELKRVLAICEKEIEKEQGRLSEVQRERTNTERDISVINSDIQTGVLEVRSLDVQIKKLNTQIEDRETEIDALSEEMREYKGLISKLLQTTNETDSRSFAHVFFSEGRLSDFLADIHSYDAVQISTQKTIEDIDRLRERYGRYVATLNDSQKNREKLRVFRNTQINTNKGLKGEKNIFLQKQKRQEKKIEETIQSREQLVLEIQSRLFELRGSKAIPFSEALEYAQFATSKTGVRTAFILGLIKQESALGRNVGTGTASSDMHPNRDLPVFQAMAEALGFDISKTPVSKKLSYGWGGAMGPAQFIPSTWVCYGGFVNTNTNSCQNTKGLSNFQKGPWVYKKQTDRIRLFTGKSSPSDPWTPRDAFMGAALLLRDNGALNNEYCAALKYYSGNCSKSNQSRFGFYPRSVLALAKQIQKDIDFINAR